LLTDVVELGKSRLDEPERGMAAHDFAGVGRTVVRGVKDYVIWTVVINVIYRRKCVIPLLLYANLLWKG
jgi:hypothetical protein